MQNNSTVHLHSAHTPLREQLAAYAHDAWSGWMLYLFRQSVRNADGSVTIPAASVARWERQSATEYADLPESEKASDRDEADKMLTLFAQERAWQLVNP